MAEEKRRAVVIGIDEYEDGDIPNLQGAKFDAIEVYQKLSASEGGLYEISTDHYLVGEKANYRNIRKAISDIFRKPDDCDVVLFYFSGHGFVDGAGHGYIAPRDMASEDAFICGISMEEIRKVMSESVIKNIVMILDCCYSGIATKGLKPIHDMKKIKENYDQSLESFSGAGAVVLASCQEHERSGESVCKHRTGDQEEHPHGRFTFHLLEGLSGYAANEMGIITLEGLRTYIENKMEDRPEQKPTLYVERGRGIENMPISISSQLVTNKIKEINRLCEKGDIEDLQIAASTLLEISKYNKKNGTINELQIVIDNTLENYRRAIDYCLTQYYTRLRKRLEDIKSGLYRKLCNLTGFLYFDKINSIEELDFLLLIILCEEIMPLYDQLNNPGISDQLVSNLIRRCQAAQQQPHKSEPAK